MNTERRKVILEFNLDRLFELLGIPAIPYGAEFSFEHLLLRVKCESDLFPVHEEGQLIALATPVFEGDSFIGYQLHSRSVQVSKGEFIPVDKARLPKEATA